MSKKHVIPCVGNRRLELSRLDDGNLLIVVALERRVRTEVAHLVIEPADRVALELALIELSKLPPGRERVAQLQLEMQKLEMASLFPAGKRVPVIKDKLRVKRYTPVVRRVMKYRSPRAT